MRVALFASDDSAVPLLTPLAGQSVLAFGSASCSVFARRCLELGLDFVSLRDDATSAAVLEGFKPDVMLCLVDVLAPPATFSKGSAPCKLVVGANCDPMAEAPSREFEAIWRSLSKSRVLLSHVGCAGEASVEVPVAKDETALTLRAKHMEAAAVLLEAFLKHGSLPTQEVSPSAAAEGQAPTRIDLSWDEATVDRFIRASWLPPLDPAIVAEPLTDETYFIEDLQQFQEFKLQLAMKGEGSKDTKSAAYAADTHWYTNVGGSIVKMGDVNIHKPVRTADRKHKAVIPGAAMGARKKLRMNEPLIGPNAERYCSSALESSWLGVEGPYVKRLEAHLARICGCHAACAVQSGTAALYGAMKALGVTHPSHHVLVPSFTCAASADAVVHAGGVPIPIDSELVSFGLSLESVRAALDADQDIVGVVIVPNYGVPARDFHEILALCKSRGLWLCEDACESYGAWQTIPLGEKAPVGSLGTLSVVSVRSEKMIGVGEGGAILGNDSTLVARAKWWCSRAPSRGSGLWRVYLHDAVGQNFRMPEMLAAVGCASAEMLPVMISRKRAIHGWYMAEFARLPKLHALHLQKCDAGDDPVWWLNSVLLPEGMPSEEVGMQLMKDYPDIEIRPGFYPLHMMPIFQSTWSRPCPNTELLYQRLLCLPSSNLLTEPDVKRICSALVDALEKVTACKAD
mmetsp:Transcript_66730/g.145532  ORF Transcript_66730/g.145532 Transcript_66730/m.145532 type:complete len:685 (+) Transcript_66730:71-2125(+)